MNAQLHTAPNTEAVEASFVALTGELAKDPAVRVFAEFGSAELSTYDQ